MNKDNDCFVGKIYLREATKEDCDLLFKWANDKVVRKNAFHSEPIEYKSHVGWFDRLLSDSTQRQYVLMRDDVAVGQLRLTQADDDIEIDYSVDTHNRGLGYGSVILKYAIEKAKEEFPDANHIIGKVKPENVASANCFEKSGFLEKYKCFEMDL